MLFTYLESPPVYSDHFVLPNYISVCVHANRVHCLILINQPRNLISNFKPLMTTKVNITSAVY